MTRKLLFAAAAILMFCGASAQTKTVGSDKLPAFRKINIVGKMKVTLRPVTSQEETSVLADLTASEAGRFEYKVNKEGQLTVKLKNPGKGEPETSPSVEICYAELAALSVSAAEVAMDGAWSGAAADLSVDNYGKLTGRVDLKDLDVSISDKALVTLDGSARYVTASAATAARLDMRKTEVMNFEARAVTNAEIYLTAGERLEARAGTNASVMYRSRPEILRDKATLGGKVSFIGE